MHNNSFTNTNKINANINNLSQRNSDIKKEKKNLLNINMSDISITNNQKGNGLDDIYKELKNFVKNNRSIYLSIRGSKYCEAVLEDYIIF